MLRGANPLLRLTTRAVLGSKTITPSSAAFHRAVSCNGVLGQPRPALLRDTAIIWRAQFSSKPPVPPIGIDRKHEEEVGQRKLEPHPERVSSESTVRHLFEPDDEGTTKVTKKDQDDVLRDLKSDVVSGFSLRYLILS